MNGYFINNAAVMLVNWLEVLSIYVVLLEINLISSFNRKKCTPKFLLIKEIV